MTYYSHDNPFTFFNGLFQQHHKGIGTEVLVYSSKNSAVASRLAKAISDASGLKNRGVKIRTDLGLLKGTNKPCYLIEVCFVNDSVDVALYRRDFEKICQGIAKVLAETVGKSINTPAAANPKEEESIMAQNLLNETGRKECKEMIQRGVEEKLFSSDHKNLDKYTDAELISYSMAYVNRKTKLKK